MLKTTHPNPSQAALDSMESGATLLLDLSNLTELGLEVRLLDPQKPLISIRIPQTRDTSYIVFSPPAIPLLERANLDPDLLAKRLENVLLEEVIKSAITLRK
jgi:hypothetical protein